MPTPVRVSRELQKLDHAKLPRDLGAKGRFSLFGIFVTLLDIISTSGICLSLLTLVSRGIFRSSGEIWVHIQVINNVVTVVPQWVHALAILEFFFFIGMKLKLYFLQSADPLEISLKTGGIMSPKERQQLWDRVMKAESESVDAYFEKWFFDAPFKQITVPELQDFISWCYFDGRHQEHLRHEELDQLDAFVKDALSRTSRRLSWQNFQKKTGGPAPNASFSSIDSIQSEFSVSEAPPPSPAAEVRVQQLLLKQGLCHSSSLPKRELTKTLRNITQKRKGSGSHDNQPSRRFMRPTADPILGVRVYPFLVNLVGFLATELPLCIVLWAMGFKRYHKDSMSYYFHPGRPKAATSKRRDETPLVFIHGMGVGCIVYIALIWEMLKTGRPIFLPQVETVSAFRPWVLPSHGLKPHQVALSMSKMLAGWGYSKATFSGHSFGTFWMTYMVKYAPDFVAGLVFLDPVCFCLYDNTLTRRAVYHPPDPGDIGHLVKTDMMVQWSIQRNFSWSTANLFVEDILDKPCVIFLSGDDRVAPSDFQEEYLKKRLSDKDFKIVEADELITTSDKFFLDANVVGKPSVVKFRGCNHGMWLLNPFQNGELIRRSMEAVSP